MKAAAASGADAVYFGVDAFNARQRAENFRLDDLPEVMQWLHQRGPEGFPDLQRLGLHRRAGAERRSYCWPLIAAGVGRPHRPGHWPLPHWAQQLTPELCYPRLDPDVHHQRCRNVAMAARVGLPARGPGEGVEPCK